ncbi:hypothetical protein KM043_015697 [Ampulex compressa]|nr:hypothetical protein KM043_015697 [Ampulex compressa]
MLLIEGATCKEHGSVNTIMIHYWSIEDPCGLRNVTLTGEQYNVAMDNELYCLIKYCWYRIDSRIFMRNRHDGWRTHYVRAACQGLKSYFNATKQTAKGFTFSQHSHKFVIISRKYMFKSKSKTLGLARDS